MTGAELRERREQLNLTRTELGAYLGVSFWTIAQWEHGRRDISMDDFALRTALATADAAREEGRALPDWRKNPVLPPVELAIVRWSAENRGEQE